MLKNYLKIAIRNIVKQKTYAFINILGLSIGLACCLIIFLFIQYELNFDSCHNKLENIYRVVTHSKHPGGMEYSGSTPYPMAAALRNDFPELEQATQVFVEGELLIAANNTRFKEDDVFFVEPQFFDIFDIQWLVGDPEHALDNPNTVVLTEKLANKYFSGESAMGKVLRLDNKMDIQVSGVIKNPPLNTSLPFQMLISAGALDEYTGERYNRWNIIYSSSAAFVELPENIKPQYFEEQFETFKKKYLDPTDYEVDSFHLQPMSDVHFNTRYGSFAYTTSKTRLYTFAAIGLLILIIACINFINLSTAQAIKRSKEVGMRKVMGANRLQLIRQLMGETTLFTFLAIAVSLVLTEITLPFLNQFLGNNIQLSLFQDASIFLFLIVTYAFVSILSGSYPALVLSRYQPAEALKSKNSSKTNGSHTFRNSLVVLQFIISQILIISTLVITSQMYYSQNKDLGFQWSGILSVPIPNFDPGKCETLRSILMQNSHIKKVSFGFGAPTTDSNLNSTLIYEESGDMKEYRLSGKPVDHHYLETFKIPLVAGRFFRNSIGDESNKEWVVRDFHLYSLHEKIIPTVFFNFMPRFFQEAEIKIASSNIPETVKFIQQEWTRAFPEYVFEYEFFDVFLKEIYESDTKLLILIQSFAFLAIFIGCLGLLGLVSFMVVQRTKEIGIRKALGSSVERIVILLTKDLIKWVLVANIVAWPIAYYALNTWLQNFVYRINISWWTFLLAGVLALVIAFLTVSYQAIRAATANPVKALRYE